jgi:hypothetical protein
MSEQKTKKWLYEFIVDKEVEVEKTEEQTINGEVVKVTKKVKEFKPTKFALRRPNRKLYENSDMHYGVKLSEGIRAGLLTRPMLLKRYRNDGGALSDPDAQYFSELGVELTRLEEDHQRINANLEKRPEEEKKKLIKEILEKKTEILQSLQALENVNQALFAHTAESKAQVSLNNFWVVYLSCWDEKNNGEYVDFFSGETYDQKMAAWDDYDENPDPFILTILTRFSLLVGLWNAGAQTEDEFRQGEKDYGTEAVKTVEEAKKPAVEKIEPVSVPAEVPTDEPVSKAPEVVGKAIEAPKEPEEANEM